MFQHFHTTSERTGKCRPLHVIQLLVAIFVSATWGEVNAAGSVNGSATFPRLIGMNIGAKNYQDASYQKDLAKLDVVILGFYKGWGPDEAGPSNSAIRKAVQGIKAIHHGILVGQYTVLNEARDDTKDAANADLRDKLNASKWWLTNAAGSKVQWTSDFHTWEINFTSWTRPDANGQRWPEWLAERNDTAFFRDIPDFDIVYLDNVMATPRVKGDWNLDGRDDDPANPAILSAYREGHAAHWNYIRKLQPKALLVGNADHDLSAPQWQGQLDGAFLEGLMGESWSIERWGGWSKMMERYRGALANTRGPKLVGFGVIGDARDYRFFRYAYTSCLLDDGYFSFTDKARGYSSVPWFDEYELKLGKALGAAPSAAWKDGVWRRDFEHGVVLINPGSSSKTVALEPGLKRVQGKQDSVTNDGSAVTRISLASKDGIVLRR